MKVKLLLQKDAGFGKHGGYECEWVYNPLNAQFLLGIQKYSSLQYIFILFDNVQGYKFSNWMFCNLAESLNEKAERGFLYKVESKGTESETINHYITFQPPRGNLQIFASSYKVLS